MGDGSGLAGLLETAASISRNAGAYVRASRWKIAASFSGRADASASPLARIKVKPRTEAMQPSQAR